MTFEVLLRSCLGRALISLGISFGDTTLTVVNAELGGLGESRTTFVSDLPEPFSQQSNFCFIWNKFIESPKGASGSGARIIRDQGERFGSVPNIRAQCAEPDAPTDNCFTPMYGNEQCCTAH
jgi:hypothetical protein